MKPVVLRIGIDPVILLRSYGTPESMLRALQPKFDELFALHSPDSVEDKDSREAFDETCKLLNYKHLVEVGFNQRLTIAFECSGNKWGVVGMAIVPRIYLQHGTNKLMFYSIGRQVERALNRLARQVAPNLFYGHDGQRVVSINPREGVKYSAEKGIVLGFRSHTMC